MEASMPEMTEAYAWRSATIVDSDGEKIGTLTEIYEDQEELQVETARYTRSVKRRHDRPAQRNELAGDRAQRLRPGPGNRSASRPTRSVAVCRGSTTSRISPASRTSGRSVSINLLSSAVTT